MTPRHDRPPPRKVSIPRPAAARPARFRPAGKKPPAGERGGEPCPVEPNRPLDLSGGAAAALEFDD